MAIRPTKTSRYVRFPDGSAVPVLYPSGSRLTGTASTASTAQAALPTGSLLVLVRTPVSLWLRFGVAGMGAAAADDNSILFPAGESVIPVPLTNEVPATHVRVLLAEGTTDAPYQFERVDCVTG